MPPIRLVAIIIGATLVIAVLLIGLLAYQGRAIPDVLQNIAVGALTAEGALLVPSRTPPGG